MAFQTTNHKQRTRNLSVRARARIRTGLTDVQGPRIAAMLRGRDLEPRAGLEPALLRYEGSV